ncbi:hypothetical protein KQH62_05940 [bacterium]|nr:hypothetical protein [bacterium]
MSRERLMYVLLGILLILTGLMAVVPSLGALDIVVAVLALVVGVLIFIAHPDISIFTGWALAAVYFILVGLQGVINFGFSSIEIVKAILALAAGVVLLVGWPRFRHQIGFFLFAVWLVLVGLVGLVSLGGLGIVIAVIAMASGVLMILNE